MSEVGSNLGRLHAKRTRFRSRYTRRGGVGVCVCGGGEGGGLRGFYLNLDPEISGKYSIKETPLDFKLIDHH